MKSENEDGKEDDQNLRSAFCIRAPDIQPEDVPLQEANQVGETVPQENPAAQTTNEAGWNQNMA